jgi:alpha-1,2-mannosyltransferase
MVVSTAGRKVSRTVAAATFLAALCGIVALGLSNRSLYFDQSDARVYRQAGALIWHGSGSLYQRSFTSAHLPFTYPPFAAVVFAPFSGLPFWVWQAGSAVLAVGCLLASARASFSLAGAAVETELVLLVAAIGLWLEPISMTLSFGQINLVLMALVLLDFTAPDSWRWRGLGVGLAAALKLTPLIFIPYLFLIGRRRAALISLLTFATSVIVGFAVLPAASRSYWGGRIGHSGDGPARLVNQSLDGVVHRLLPAGGLADLTWLMGALAVGTAGLIIAAATARQGQELLGICVCAATGLLVSPISWSHHWVWVLPLLAGTVAAPHWRRSVRVAVVATIIGLFGWWPLTVGPHGEFAGSAKLHPSGFLRIAPHENGAELRWSGWQLLYGDYYAIFGVVVLAVAAAVQLRARRGPGQDSGVITTPTSP